MSRKLTKTLLPEPQFADTVKRIVESHPKISGDDMIGMLQDVWHFFEEDSAFSQIEVRRTECLENLIKVVCWCPASGPSSVEIAQRLEAIWLNNLRYHSGEEAHIIVQTDEAVILKAITVPGLDDYYVSRKVNVNLSRASGRDSK